MAEIMRILYVKVQKRCQKNVLRLHNQIFLHAATCEEVIGKPIILTEKKNYMAVTCSHWCAMHLSNITSLLHIYSRSANTQQQKHHLNILQAHLWQHQADDLERSSHLNWSGCKQKWNKVKSVDEVPFKTKSDNWGNYPSPCQKQKIVSSHVEFSSNTTALIKLT